MYEAITAECECLEPMSRALSNPDQALVPHHFANVWTQRRPLLSNRKRVRIHLMDLRQLPMEICRQGSACLSHTTALCFMLSR